MSDVDLARSFALSHRMGEMILVMPPRHGAGEFNRELLRAMATLTLLDWLSALHGQQRPLPYDLWVRRQGIYGVLDV